MNKKDGLQISINMEVKSDKPNRTRFSKTELNKIKKYLDSGMDNRTYTDKNIRKKFIKIYGKKILPVSNGTITMSAILHCLGIGTGDEVIVPDIL